MNPIRAVLQLIPTSNSIRCIIGLALGIVYGVLLPSLVWLLEPMATVFVRASVIVILPFVTLEIVASLGHLSDTSLRAFARAGSVVILLFTLIGLAAALYAGTLLPDVLASGFFTPQILESKEQINLYDTFFPSNLFRALSEDNFAAIVLVSVAFGLIVQRLPNKKALLDPLQQIRQALNKFNSIIARVAPIGVFCLIAQSITMVSLEEWAKMYAFPLVTVCTAVIVTVLLIGMLLSSTPLRLSELLRAIRGPVAVTASSGSLFIALPLIIESMRELLVLKSNVSKKEAEEIADKVSASIPIGFALPNVGQILMLSVLPYMGWFVDLHMSMLQRLKVFLVSIPYTAGGTTVAVRKGVDLFHLPPDVISIFFVNYEWMTRLEKSLSAVALFSLVAYLVAGHFSALRVHRWKLTSTLITCTALIFATSLFVPQHLLEMLKTSYKRDKYLLGLQPLVHERMPSTITYVHDLSDSTLATLPIADANLDSLHSRGYIRVGVYVAGLPWSWIRPDGKLVGYEVDMIQELAQTMNVKIRYYICSLPLIDSLILQERIDVAIGAFPDNTIMNSAVNTSWGYQPVHLALLIKDNTHMILADARHGTLKRPYVLGSYDKIPATAYIQSTIARELSLTSNPVSVRIVAFPSDMSYSTAMDDYNIDAVVVSAEYGAAYAILHPEFTMYPAFGRKLPLSIVMLTAGDNTVFAEYVDMWIYNMRRREFFTHLQKHWIEAENDL